MTFWILGQNEAPQPNMALLSLSETVAHNGTIFFALISGILFSVILADRGWPKFFKSKLLNVILPYCLFSFIFTFFNWNFEDGLMIFSGDLSEFLAVSLGNIVSGQASFQFWYIPVLAVLFVLTPALTWLMKQAWAEYLLAVILVVPLFVSRTFPENSVANVVVFLAPYTFGLWLGARYETRIELVQRWAGLLVAIATAASVLTFYLFYSYYGPLQVEQRSPEGPVNWFESASYAQKMTLAGLVLLILRAKGDWLPRWLDLLAVNAFAIYFIHVFLLFSWFAAINRFLASPPSALLTALSALAIWVGLLALSVAVSSALRKIFGRKSRLLIGS